MHTLGSADCANINGGGNRSSHLSICPPLTPLSPHHPAPHSFVHASIHPSIHSLVTHYATIYFPSANLPVHWSSQPLAHALAFYPLVCISPVLYSFLVCPPLHSSSHQFTHASSARSSLTSCLPITIPPPTHPSSHPSAHSPHF